VGIRGVFDRIGQRTLLQQYGDQIANYFVNKGEYGAGVRGVSQVLGWLFKLHKELHPEAIHFWIDASNGYNEMRRSAIAEGLADMPPNLHWLRKSFDSFYSGDVVLYFSREGETHNILSQIGTVQGDGNSSIFFNAGLQRAFDRLRGEYPEAMLTKYIDDVMGGLQGPTDASGQPLRCHLHEPRTFAGDNVYPMIPNPDPLLPPLRPTSVPMALPSQNAGPFWSAKCVVCELRKNAEWRETGC
jgi:hypothetical protein